MSGGTKQVVLTRRNLTTLLDKLDHVKNGGESMCTIIKSDTVHPRYPLKGVDNLYVVAVEDDEYYTDRDPGFMKDMDTGEAK